MIVTPDEIDKERARKIYSMFESMPESKHIASAWSLMNLSALQRMLNPKRVLEFGGGIGCLTTLLLYSNAKIVTHEKEDRFIAMHRENVGEHPRLTLTNTLDDIAETPGFDLIVVDGEMPVKAVKFFKPRVVVFVEGTREAQRRLMETRGIKFAMMEPDPATEHFIKPFCRKKYCSIGV